MMDRLRSPRRPGGVHKHLITIGDPIKDKAVELLLPTGGLCGVQFLLTKRPKFGSAKLLAVED